jgi:nitrogen-specific signal transduction histidine kinase
MELLALLSNNDDIVIPGVRSALKKYTVYPLKTTEELEDLYSNIPLNLLIVDTTTHKLSLMDNFLRRLDANMVVLIMPESPDRYTMNDFPESVYDWVDINSIGTELPVKVERAFERQRVKSELRLIQSRDHLEPVGSKDPVRSNSERILCRGDSMPGGRFIHEKVIVNFARMLSASFNMQKLLDHFIDSVMEIVRVSKMSVMLKDKEGFYVKTNYGLDPYIADNLRLSRESAIATWLARTGRILNKPVRVVDSLSMDIKKEMEALQCSVSIPMVNKGKLIGIFNMNSKIAEEPFYREELEVIYVLCNYLAAAVKDIDLYHQMWYQKEFTKNIISSMNSGMIAIDKDEKISIFNQQAADVLNLDPSRIIGRDLRALPSPLGDILYETMITGTSYKRYEATVHPMKMPLGINSYRLLDEQEKPIGAGIIFSDLSDSKKLEEQLRRTEKLKAVNDIMAKIAHEVRNPLTSIQTYTQLLHDKYPDEDLGKFYVSTVSQSIRRLDDLIDKLITFSSTQKYNFQKDNINDIMRDASEFISKNIPETHKFTRQLMEESFFVNADRKHLIKGIYYLVQNIVDRSPDGTFILMNARAISGEKAMVELAITYGTDKKGKEGDQDLLKPLLDIHHLGTELNVPISNKIIEGHDGILDIIHKDDLNSFVIRLPLVNSQSDGTSMKGGEERGRQRKDSGN